MCQLLHTHKNISKVAHDIKHTFDPLQPQTADKLGFKIICQSFWKTWIFYIDFADALAVISAL